MSEWGPRGAREGVRLAALLALEIAVRALRLPVFPGFAPLLGEGPMTVRLGYAGVLAAVEIAFLGPGGWELVAACVAGGLVALRRRRPLLVFAASATAVFTLLGVLASSLAPGSFGLETLLAAVLVRATGSEARAAVLARGVVVALVCASLALVRVARLPARRLPLAALAVLALATACADREDTAFTPQPSGPGESVEIRFAEADTARAPHPVLPEDARGNDACLGCHRAKIGPTDLPLARKGFHEIHAEIAQLAAPCVACHEGAGRPGFPGEHPQEAARSSYNQRCQACHSGEGGPRWARRMR